MGLMQGFKNNWMARRAELFGVLRSNEHWVRGALVDFTQGDTPCHCNVGHYLHTKGVSDNELGNMSTLEAMRRVSNMTGLDIHTIDTIVGINDQSDGSFETNVKGLNAYLLGKSLKRAKEILGRPTIGYRWSR